MDRKYPDMKDLFKTFLSQEYVRNHQTFQFLSESMFLLSFTKSQVNPLILTTIRGKFLPGTENSIGKSNSFHWMFFIVNLLCFTYKLKHCFSISHLYLLKYKNHWSVIAAPYFVAVNFSENLLYFPILWCKFSFEDPSENFSQIC